MRNVYFVSFIIFLNSSCYSRPYKYIEIRNVTSHVRENVRRIKYFVYVPFRNCKNNFYNFDDNPVNKPVRLVYARDDLSNEIGFVSKSTIR